MKRALEIATVSLGLFVLLPVLAMIAILVRLDSPGPILNRERRVGRGGRDVTQSWFRTTTDPSLPGGLARTTRLGRFLRDTSLDTLPGLIDVAAGRLTFGEFLADQDRI